MNKLYYVFKVKRIRVCGWLLPKRYKAITLFPFIFLASKNTLKDKEVLNHEEIHLRQQKELLVLFFYLWYLIDFGVKYYKHRNWKKAYHNIIFEREAYANGGDLNYLKNRKLFAFWKYR